MTSLGAHGIEDMPNIHFLDKDTGKKYYTNDFSGKAEKFYGVKIECTPVL